MKYFLGINQKVWVEKYPEADYITAIIFEIIKNFCAFKDKKIKKIIVDNEEYTWISYKAIINEIPILRIKSKHPVSTRINLLKKLGLIKTLKVEGGNMYVRLTEKASELIFDYTVSLGKQGVSVGEQGPVSLGEHYQNTNLNKKQNNNNKIILHSKQEFAGKDINYLIGLFKEINPTYERLFSNKSQRSALERLVKKFGKEKVEKMIKLLPKIFGRPYAPTITTPIELEKKLANLLAFLKKEKLISEQYKIAKI